MQSSILHLLSSILTSSSKYTERQIERDAPVPRVDDLADAKVASFAAQDIGILAVQPLLAAEPDDHVAHSVLRVFHKIRPNRGGYEVALLVELGLDGAGCRVELEAPRSQAAAFHHVEAQAELHRALDPGDADLAVALGGVAVAGRKQRAWHEHRQVQLGADIQVARIDIAAGFGGRQHGVRARLV